MDNFGVKLMASGGLLSTPWWLQAIYGFNVAAATVSVTCGAILGVAAVYHLIRGRR